MKTIAKVILFVPLMLLCVNSAQANFVANPGFETFTASFDSFGGAQLPVGSTALTGWSIVGGEVVELKNINFWDLTPSDGNYFLDLTGYTNVGFPKGVSQTLTNLTAGQTYSFNMDLGIRNGACGSSDCTGPIQVSTSIGNTSQTFTHNSFDSGNIWGTFGFDFTADNQSMTLTILGISGNQYIGLDKVSVAPVPLPAAVWLFGSGLLTLLGFSNIRRKLSSENA